ncbi:type II secretion system protein [Actinoplanes sp. TFC3]|uniref:type II secretion system protein n=1 Tax=Actinoplanes sp. TFC3 TaxID=1710355 RepID=UPI000837A3B8|nr:prepilin-type N-terminal cleavage/methylation domain-containing protein [Actinoplanes sp. TFC3]
MQEIINRLRAKKGDEGFTLIELLVVVVIIGVLVAIAVPVYLNYREGAADKSAQSDVRGAISAVEQYYTNNGNAYPGDVAATTGTGGKIVLPATGTGGTAGTITISDGTTLQLKNNSTYYVICANNSGGTKNKYYQYNSQNGGSVKASAATTMAACIAG